MGATPRPWHVCSVSMTTYESNVLARKISRIVWLGLVSAGISFFARVGSAQQLGLSTPKMGSAFMVNGPHAQSDAISCKRLKVDLMGQFATGVLGAWIGGGAAYAAVYELDPSEMRVRGDAGYKPNANTAFAIGSWAGSTALVFVSGRRAGRRACGSLGRTALGTGIPSVILLLGRHEGYLPLLGGLFIAPLQALGGTLMFPRR